MSRNLLQLLNSFRICINFRFRNKLPGGILQLLSLTTCMGICLDMLRPFSGQQWWVITIIVRTALTLKSGKEIIGLPLKLLSFVAQTHQRDNSVVILSPVFRGPQGEVSPVLKVWDLALILSITYVFSHQCSGWGICFIIPSTNSLNNSNFY